MHDVMFFINDPSQYLPEAGRPEMVLNCLARGWYLPPMFSAIREPSKPLRALGSCDGLSPWFRTLVIVSPPTLSLGVIRPPLLALERSVSILFALSPSSPLEVLSLYPLVRLASLRFLSLFMS